MRSLFISSGHSNTPGRDRGAAGNGYVEGNLTVEYRKLLVAELRLLGVNAVTDVDDTILSQSIAFFKNLTKKDSIVLDIHWNAASPAATGVETIVPEGASYFEKMLGRGLSNVVHQITGIPLRGNYGGYKGVRSESETPHKRLGWMRLTGENVLIEMGFITSKNDMATYQKFKYVIAREHSKLLKSYLEGNTIDYKYSGTNEQNIQASAPKTYTVKTGDTLYYVASVNKISVQRVIELNGLKSNVIKIGQVLKVS